MSLEKATTATSENLNKDGIKIEPWRRVFISQEKFINDLECISEMFELIAPTLASKDKERDARIQALTIEKDPPKEGILRAKTADDARELLNHLKKIRRSDRMFRQGVIISIVSRFDDFFRQALTVAYEHNPGWLKNPDKKISYKEIFEINSIEDFKKGLIEKEIDNLMRDSHHAQIDFIDSKLKLGISQNFSNWKSFLEITERRNLFVHTGGKISIHYINNCKHHEIPLSDKIKEGVFLAANDNYITTTIDIFYEMAVRVSQAVVRRMFPDNILDADEQLNNGAIDLLTPKHHLLAERIYRYSLDIPDNLRTHGDMKYYSLINLCLALKLGGKEFTNLLNTVDWTPFHPKYHLAIAVLKEDFDNASKLMKIDSVVSELGETAFKKWPLFYAFRGTSQFKDAYASIFKKDFDAETLRETKSEAASA